MTNFRAKTNVDQRGADIIVKNAESLRTLRNIHGYPEKGAGSFCATKARYTQSEKGWRQLKNVLFVQFVAVSMELSVLWRGFSPGTAV